MSLRWVQWNVPIMATFLDCPGASTRRCAPRLVQAHEIGMCQGLTLIAEQKHEVAGLGLRLAQLEPQTDMINRGGDKHRYYEAVEGASAACHPGVTNPTLEDAHIAEATAEAALKVVKKRSQRASDSKDDLAMFLTDAYATVAVAYRRAAGVYAIDEEMQKLGTAAVHLLTIATSHMKAHPDENAS